MIFEHNSSILCSIFKDSPQRENKGFRLFRQQLWDENWVLPPKSWT